MQSVHLQLTFFRFIYFSVNVKSILINSILMGQTDSRSILQSLEEPSIPLSQSFSQYESTQASTDSDTVSINALRSTESLNNRLERAQKSVDFHRQHAGGIRPAGSLANASAATTKSFPYLMYSTLSSLSTKNPMVEGHLRESSIKKRRFLRLPRFRTRINPAPKLSPKGAFHHLPNELCLYILRLMDIPSIGRMASVSKTWNQLCSTDLIYQWLAVDRYSIHSSRIPLLMRDANFNVDFWKTLYIQLDSGLTAWTGLALDPVTNSSRPYSIELIVKSVRHRLHLRSSSTSSSISSKLSSTTSRPSKYLRLSEFDGCCRWTDLGNALTRIEGTLTDSASSARFNVDPFVNTHVARNISFDETAIIYGHDLAIPNKYHGLLIGNVMLGTYNPGHPSLIGSFGILMNDSLPYLCPNNLSLVVGKSYKGHLFLASETVTPHDMARYVELRVTQDSQTELKAVFRIYPLSPAQTTLQSKIEPRIEDIMALDVNLTAKIATSVHPVLKESTVIFSSSRFSRSSNEDAFEEGMIRQWIPLDEEIQLYLQGNSLFGLFLSPAAGAFYINLN